MDRLLASYPRTRPPLSPSHQASYLEHYLSNRSGEGCLSAAVLKLESWMHRSVAAGGCSGDVLEIGAGNLNHLPYHPGAEAYDVIEPFRELWQNSLRRARLRRIYSDISEIEGADLYDRILSVAVLEHLTDLPLVLARAGLLLREDGVFAAGFPSEGGILWGLAWRSTTGVAYRVRRGLDYGSIMRHEHLNRAEEILALLSWFFADVKVTRFPLPIHHLSFYTTARARRPRLDRCRDLCVSRCPAAAPKEPTRL